MNPNKSQHLSFVYLFPRRQGLRGGEAGQRTHQAAHERLHDFQQAAPAPRTPEASQPGQQDGLQGG